MLAMDLKGLALDFDRVQEQIEMLLSSDDMSIATQRLLLHLQHLLANARPDETVLLANYPNPFNPETWIPYHLAESTDVRMNIYDAQGTLVRELTLGHQSTEKATHNLTDNTDLTKSSVSITQNRYCAISSRFFCSSSIFC